MRRAHALAFLVTLLAGAACSPPSIGSYGPPTAPAVVISPAHPRARVDLKANLVAESTDPGGNTLTYTYMWLKDGVPQDGLAADTVPGALTRKGDEWLVLVTPDNGATTGPAGQATATIENTPPVVTLAFVPAAPTVATALEVVAVGQDADGESVRFAYVWTRDGQSTSFVTNAIPPAQLARGQQWQVTVTPSDDTASGAPETASVEVANARPVLSTLSLAPEHPTREAALVAAPGAATDADGDTLVIKHAWTVDGALVDGQVGRSLAPAHFQKGSVVVVWVTPSDSREDGTALSATATIENAPPQLASVRIDPPAGGRGTTFTCQAEGWLDPDGDPAALNFLEYSATRSVPCLAPHCSLRAPPSCPPSGETVGTGEAATTLTQGVRGDPH